MLFAACYTCSCGPSGVVQASSSDNSPVRAQVLFSGGVQQKLSGGLRDRIAGLRLELGCRRAGQAAGSRQRHKTLAFGVARADLPGAQPDTAGQVGHPAVSCRGPGVVWGPVQCRSAGLPVAVGGEQSADRAAAGGARGGAGRVGAGAAAAGEHRNTGVDNLPFALQNCLCLQAVNQKSVMQYEQREKLFVIRKLEEMEAELRLLVYSEQLASQVCFIP